MKQQSVQFCDGCGMVRDDIEEIKDPRRWVELRDFQMRYGFKPDDLVLAHTYCPGCKEAVQSVAGGQSPPRRANR